MPFVLVYNMLGDVMVDQRAEFLAESDTLLTNGGHVDE